eukprot:m.1624391 g.1624391  ORF g.1624391 m.1624391 type:complete len:50 (+) comp25388_c0_seq5:5707-5856(+)
MPWCFPTRIYIGFDVGSQVDSSELHETRCRTAFIKAGNRALCASTLQAI